MLTPFEQGLVAHLIADWLLQNDWMARNKKSLKHPAAWTHAVIYAVLLGLALGWQAGLVLAGLHLLIDTRVPLWVALLLSEVELQSGQPFFRATPSRSTNRAVAGYQSRIGRLWCGGDFKSGGSSDGDISRAMDLDAVAAPIQDVEGSLPNRQVLRAIRQYPITRMMICQRSCL